MGATARRDALAESVSSVPGRPACGVDSSWDTCRTSVNRQVALPERFARINRLLGLPGGSTVPAAVAGWWQVDSLG